MSGKSELLTLTPLISARFYLRPGFFDPVASKGLRVYVSGLESTLTGISTSVDSKEVARGEKGQPADREFRRSTASPGSPGLKPNQLHKGIAQIYLTTSIRSS